jgi:hypothetical protein
MRGKQKHPVEEYRRNRRLEEFCRLLIVKMIAS